MPKFIASVFWLSLLAIACSQTARVQPKTACAQHFAPRRCGSANDWNACVQSIEAKCSEKTEQEQLEIKRGALIRKIEEESAAHRVHEEEERQEQIRTCEDRLKAEREAQEAKYEQDVQTWIGEHQKEWNEINALYSGGARASKDLAATPDDKREYDHYEGRYYLDKEKRFETTHEAAQRRLAYRDCKRSGDVGCDRVSNRAAADQADMREEMNREKYLWKAGYPSRPPGINCDCDGRIRVGKSCSAL